MDQHRDHGIGDTFAHGPSQLGGIAVKAGGIPLNDQLVLVYDDDGPCIFFHIRGVFCKSLIDGSLQLNCVYVYGWFIQDFCAIGPWQGITQNRPDNIKGWQVFFNLPGRFFTDEGASQTFPVDGFYPGQTEDRTGGRRIFKTDFERTEGEGQAA